MREDWILLAALLAGLVGFGWAINQVIGQVASLPVDVGCISPSDCFQLLADTL